MNYFVLTKNEKYLHYIEDLNQVLSSGVFTGKNRGITRIQQMIYCEYRSGQKN